MTADLPTSGLAELWNRSNRDSAQLAGIGPNLVNGEAKSNSR
jgi:hypothetical protein